MELWARWAVPNASSCCIISKHSKRGKKWSWVGITDVYITKSSQSLSELLNLGLVGLDLVTLLVLGATFLLRVESQVLEQNNLTARGLVHSLFCFRANAVLCEDDAAAKELLELGDNRLQAVFGIDLAVGTAKMGHEDDSFGAVVDCIFNGGQSTDNSLVVGDFLFGVEGHIEIDLCGSVSVQSGEICAKNGSFCSAWKASYYLRE